MFHAFAQLGIQREAEILDAPLPVEIDHCLLIGSVAELFPFRLDNQRDVAHHVFLSVAEYPATFYHLFIVAIEVDVCPKHVQGTVGKIIQGQPYGIKQPVLFLCPVYLGQHLRQIALHFIYNSAVGKAFIGCKYYRYFLCTGFPE